MQEFVDDSSAKKIHSSSNLVNIKDERRKMPCSSSITTENGDETGKIGDSSSKTGKIEDECLHRSNTWTGTGEKMGYLLVWVQKMDLYEHLETGGTVTSTPKTAWSTPPAGLSTPI